MSKPILVWMNCYGGWAPELRQPVETIGYSAYLDDVVSALISLKDQIKVLYVSGGMYDAKHRTECETVIPELKRRLIEKGFSDLEIIADTESVTSITIVKVFLETWQIKFKDYNAILFCDEVRYPTNAYALEYFANKIKFDLPPVKQILVPIRRLDNHPNSTPEVQADKLRKMKELGVEAVEEEGKQLRKEHLKI